MSNEVNNVSPLERYLALKTIRDNVYYEKPLTYNTLDIADDIPGNARSLSLWYGDVLPSLGIISKDPDKRREQIARAIAKVKTTKGSTKNTARQALTNAATLGISGVPASAAVSTLMRFLGPRVPFAKGQLRNPFTLKKNLSSFKQSRPFQRDMIKNILNDSIQGGMLSGMFGALTPVISATAKPSDKALEEAGEIIAQSPNVTALPPVDIVAAINGKNSSRAENSLIGGATGALLGTAGSFIPAGLNLPKHLLMGILKRKLPFKDIARDFATGAKSNIPLNAAAVGATGAIGGALLPTAPKIDE